MDGTDILNIAFQAVMKTTHPDGKKYIDVTIFAESDEDWNTITEFLTYRGLRAVTHENKNSTAFRVEADSPYPEITVFPPKND